MTSDLFRGLGIEITLDAAEDFLLVKETLLRIGIASKKENILYPSCNILHKQGRYAILHFKEMFLMDSKDANITEDDIDRRNTIVSLLAEWELLRIIDPSLVEKKAPMSSIKVLAFKDKKDWVISPKYTIGGSKRK
jgi:hypothetical protein